MHVAYAPAGGTHAEHDEPHVATLVLVAHIAPHAWYPALHVNPHVPALHVAVPFVGAVHAVHEPPHVSGEVLFAQLAPHAW